MSSGNGTVRFLRLPCPGIFITELDDVQRTRSMFNAICNAVQDIGIEIIISWSRDHSIRHMPFPSGGPLEPSLYNAFRDICILITEPQP